MTFSVLEVKVQTLKGLHDHSLPVNLLCRSNVNVNDVLGDYSLTLVDALDTLAVSLAR